MQSAAMVQLGWENLESSGLNGVMFTSHRFDKDPRFAGLVNEAVSAYNDLPPNLGKLGQVLGDALSNPGTIAKVVDLNPALAGKVIRVVNGGNSGLKGKVTNLRRATTLLGFDTIGGFLESSSAFMKNRMNDLPEALPLGELWCHSLAVSRIAGVISDTIGGLDTATLVTAGLLHDSGKLVLAGLDRQKFDECLDKASEEDDDILVALELESIGVSHPLLSGVLVRGWNCPERLWSTIMYQAHMERAPHPKMSAVLCLSEFIARANGLGSDGQKANIKIAEKAAKILGVPPEGAPRLVDNLQLDEILADCRMLMEWE